MSHLSSHAKVSPLRASNNRTLLRSLGLLFTCALSACGNSFEAGVQGFEPATTIDGLTSVEVPDADLSLQDEIDIQVQFLANQMDAEWKAASGLNSEWSSVSRVAPVSLSGRGFDVHVRVEADVTYAKVRAWQPDVLGEETITTCFAANENQETALQRACDETVFNHGEPATGYTHTATLVGPVDSDASQYLPSFVAEKGIQKYVADRGLWPFQYFQAAQTCVVTRATSDMCAQTTDSQAPCDFENISERLSFEEVIHCEEVGERNNYECTSDITSPTQASMLGRVEQILSKHANP